MADNFRARDIAMKAQKKILSRMSTKSVAKVFVDDRMGALLDNVYKLCKTYVSHDKITVLKQLTNKIFLLDPKQKGG